MSMKLTPRVNPRVSSILAVLLVGVCCETTAVNNVAEVIMKAVERLQDTDPEEKAVGTVSRLQPHMAT